MAREALRALGIVPTPGLIRSWIQAARAEERRRIEAELAQATPNQPADTTSSGAGTPRRPKHPRGYSKSNLEPVLRQTGTLERQRGPSKPGRPRVVASWFPTIAQSMAEGKSLREALQLTGVTLDKEQIRALYRNSELLKLRQVAQTSK